MAIQVMTPGNEDIINKHARWVAQQNFERVLDVGGLEKPLRPATHVLDLFPYHQRRVDEGRGDLPERFTAETWTRWDINKIPWPFCSYLFDYVWCCQVLEDIRDPIGVCREMQRVGKAGFISTVHRSYESSTVQYDGVVGYHHHRWLIEAWEDQNTINFTWKTPILQQDPEYRAPKIKSWLLNIGWEKPFKAIEIQTGGDRGQYQDLEMYLAREDWS
jgi:hypothetical protein